MQVATVRLCSRCGNPTNRPHMAEYCWVCKPAVETENRLKREAKKKLKTVNKVK